MPKMKTLKAAAKRLKRKPSGKIKFKHANARHLLAAKSQGAKRAHRKRGYLSDADVGRARKMLPHG
jgi:large subunit ribosomal protein L35